MASLDPIKAALEALKEQANRLIHGKQATALIVMQSDETKEEAIMRVCGPAGLPRVMMNGRPVPHLIIRGVVPTKHQTMETAIAQTSGMGSSGPETMGT